MRSIPVLLVVGLIVIALATNANAAEPPDVDRVVRFLDDLFRSSASIARLEIHVTGARTERSLRVKAWTKGEDRALVVVEAPPRERGITTLRVGENLWNHLPNIDRTIRVPPSMMLSSWMGTDFTHDDLVKESTLRRDYDSRIHGRSTDPAGWIVEATAKAGTVGRWARIETVISDDGWLPQQERFFDRQGSLARVLHLDDVRSMGGRRIPTRLTLVPENAGPKRTELRYLDVQFNADVPEDTFSLSRLERRR